MSSLWTPGGERAVPPPETAEMPASDSDIQRPAMTQDELEAELARVRDELARTPPEVVVANHCFGFFELAALHLSLSPPQLAEATLAIDAMSGVVEGLAGRLGEAEPQLREALAQLRLAFVQVRAGNLGTTEPPSPT